MRESYLKILLAIIFITSALTSLTIVVSQTGTASISGVKWYDADADGIKDPAEPTSGNWTIQLRDSNNALLEETTTDENGYYEFTQLEAREYRIYEVMKEGWHQTYPGKSGIHMINLGTGENITDRDFGNELIKRTYGTISGYKWEDIDADGIWDPDEPALEGWNITISGDTNDSTITDQDGLYYFEDLPTGNYTISEILKTAWNQTYPGGDGSHTIELAPGEFNTDNNFGNERPEGSISGYKWEDLDGDGVWDMDEPALEGWTITLSGDASDSTTTDQDGAYLFQGLLEGTYTVSETLEPGWTQTYPGGDGTHTINLGDGEFSSDNNFGNFQNVNVTACKMEDLDGNIGTTGDQTPISGWTVYLSINGVRQTPGQATGPDGCYTWTDLPPGNSYDVEEDVPAGWINLTLTSNDFGQAVPGEVYSYTFVNFQLGSKSGYKWEDLDGDGIWDMDESTLEGWSIQLTDGTGAFITDTTTDINGFYEFTNLEPGDYRVYEVIKTGWVQTYPMSPNYHEFTVTSGFMEENNNFGNQRPVGSISGYKWEDLNGDGVWDMNETALEGWTMNLSGDASDSTTTDQDGAYIFEDLLEGEYTVSETLEPGWTQTYPTGAGEHNINLPAGGASSNNNFGNQFIPPPPSVGGDAETIKKQSINAEIITSIIVLTLIAVIVTKIKK
jgi:hypothetical protein